MGNETMASAKRDCEDALSRCYPLGEDASRKLHAQFSRHWCQVLDCRIREEKLQAEQNAHMPVAILLILIVLACFVVFAVVVCCVDYSDDIVKFLVDSGL